MFLATQHESIDIIEACTAPVSDARMRAVPSAEARGGKRDVVAAVRHCAAGAVVELQADDARLQVVMSICGVVRPRGVEGVNELGLGEPLVVGQAGPAQLVACEAVSLLVVDIARTAIQAEAFARSGTPRRVGRMNFKMDRADGHPLFAEALALGSAASVFRFRGAEKTRAHIEGAFVGAIAGEFLDRSETEGLFPVAGSVERALARLSVAERDPVTLDDILRAAGVIHLTLRRSVKDITGAPLARLLQEARLDWANRRLASDRESRSMRELAAALDLQPVAFSRSYQRRFGETPTQTRMQAFSGRV